MADSKLIPKGERDELRRIVRGDFKALSEEIEVRRMELYAEIEKRVATRFLAHENTIAKTTHEISAVVDEANAKLTELLAHCQKETDGYELVWAPLSVPNMYFRRQKRDEMRRAMLADVDARVAQAKASTKRQEVELLKRLSVGALESESAHDFLNEIPTVAELVPSSRLAELESQFGELPPGVVSLFPEDGNGR